MTTSHSRGKKLCIPTQLRSGHQPNIAAFLCAPHNRVNQHNFTDICNSSNRYHHSLSLLRKIGNTAAKEKLSQRQTSNHPSPKKQPCPFPLSLNLAMLHPDLVTPCCPSKWTRETDTHVRTLGYQISKVSQHSGARWPVWSLALLQAACPQISSASVF